jgi:hypothetical protein
MHDRAAADARETRLLVIEVAESPGTAEARLAELVSDPGRDSVSDVQAVPPSRARHWIAALGGSEMRAGDPVVAVRNDCGAGFLHGDRGRAVAAAGGLAVALEGGAVVPADGFAVARVTSFHRMQGGAFRDVLVLADGSVGEGELKAAAGASRRRLTVVGTAAAVEAMTGPLDDLARVARMLEPSPWQVEVIDAPPPSPSRS